MTLLSEALAQRKQLLKSITSIEERLTGASIRYEDDGPEEIGPILVDMENALEGFRTISIAINKTNNATTLTFDGKSMTLMEAVALRERLLLGARSYRRIADHIKEAVSGRRGGYRSPRSKDNVRTIAVWPLADAQQTADSDSEEVRRLDLVIQQKNWTTELLD